MIATGQTTTGGWHGTHVPLPTAARRLPQRTRRTGLDWGDSKPDPDAIARLVRQGVLTVTDEVVEDKRVVRKARRAPAPKRTPGPSAGVTYPPRFDVDKAVELYLSGMSTIAVAAAVGVKHPQSIRKRLAERGIPLRPQAPVKRHNHPVEQVAADYLAGASMRALAIKYSASKGTVKKILVAQGVALRDDGIPRSQRPERTEA